MEKGININKLVCNESKIFKISFDYDDWPGNHTDDSYEIRPYNGSFFYVRDYYTEVFPEEKFESIEGKNVVDKQVFKIKYSINILPSIGEHVISEDVDNDGVFEESIEHEDVSLVNLFQETEEVDIFDAECIQETIQFKWDTYGERFHMFGFFMHCVYILVMNIYVANAFMKPETGDGSGNTVYVILLCIGILYPWLYDLA
jgi:hypothetical protein